MAKRNYDNNYGSVTQILAVLRKIGLEFWFKKNTAAFCNEESRKGKEIGVQIHDVIQNHIEKKEAKVETQYGEEIMNALNGFMLFKKEHPEIKLKKAEIILTSEKYGFNGTMDCLGQKGKCLIMGDWKTGKVRRDKGEVMPDIYDEYLYQVSAYVMAYNEQEKANIKSAFIVAFAKNEVSYNLLDLEWDQIQACFNEVFLPCLKIYNYQKGR